MCRLPTAYLKENSSTHEICNFGLLSKVCYPYSSLPLPYSYVDDVFTWNNIKYSASIGNCLWKKVPSLSSTRKQKDCCLSLMHVYFHSFVAELPNFQFTNSISDYKN